MWEIECPACGYRQPVALPDGVHVSRCPDLRAQTFDRRLRRIECVACDRSFIGQRPFVYTDMDRKHWLLVALESERSSWPELEPVVDATFERAFVGSPLVREMRDGFRVRLVFGLEELREKLVIWRAAMDDATIEAIKLAAVLEAPRLMRATAIVVDEIPGDGSLVLAIDRGEHVVIGADMVASMHDNHTLRTRFPELFGGRYVAIARLLGDRYQRVPTA